MTESDEKFTFDKFISNIPIAGHIKGVIHYARGDIEKGKTTMRDATQSIGVMAGGMAGRMAAAVGGPVASISGAFAG